MSSGNAESGPDGPGMSETQDLPKDGKVVAAMLRHMGITDYEPGVIDQLLEFVYKYVTDVLEEAKVYAEYSNKPAGSGSVSIDSKDVELAVSMISSAKPSIPPPRDVLLSLAAEKNSTPLPPIKPGSGIKLPADRYCLLQPNYKLKNSRQILVAKPKFDPVAIAGGAGSQRGMSTTTGYPGSNMTFFQSHPGAHSVPFYPPANPMSSSSPMNTLRQANAADSPSTRPLTSGPSPVAPPINFLETSDNQMGAGSAYSPASDFGGQQSAGNAGESASGYRSAQPGRSLFRVVTSEPPESRKRKADFSFELDEDDS